MILWNLLFPLTKQVKETPYYTYPRAFFCFSPKSNGTVITTSFASEPKIECAVSVREKNILKVHETYCGNHVMIYISQLITPYTLYSAVCQYLNKMGRKNIYKNKFWWYTKMSSDTLRFVNLSQRHSHYKDLPVHLTAPPQWSSLALLNCALLFCGFGVVCGHGTKYFPKCLALRLPSFNHLPN